MLNIGIAGSGYVGLTTGICLAHLGNRVICYDVDKNKIASLKNGELPIYEPQLDELLYQNRKSILFTDNIEKMVSESDVIYIAVGTPSAEDGSADLRYVKEVAKGIGISMRRYHVIVNKSTVPVGTGDFVQSIISEHYKGEFDVVSNPEFLREGRAVKDFLEPDRVVIGTESRKAEKIMLKVYKNIPKEKIIVTDRKSAEMIKYASNAFLAFCISFVNELTQRYPDANIYEATEVMKKEINPQGFFTIGIGFGGSCFPKDVKEFISSFKKRGLDAKILEEIIEINQKQKLYFIPKIIKEVENRISTKIGVIGLSFKPETDDIREAPSIEIIKTLKEKIPLAGIYVYDPAAMEEAKRVLGNDVIYCKSAEDVYDSADALIISTEWDEFKNIDIHHLKRKMKYPIVFDGRNIFYKRDTDDIEYHGVGTGKRILSSREINSIIDNFYEKSCRYAEALQCFAEKSGTAIGDVMAGVMADTRIGKKPFYLWLKGRKYGKNY